MAWERTDANYIKNIYHSSESNMDMLRRFIEANGFDRMHDYQPGANIKKVLLSGGFYGRYSSENDPPYHDHKQYFKNTKTGLCCLTYNPYEQADKIRAKIKKWAHDNGLEADVYDASHSWYSPNNTCFVVIHLPGRKIVLE